MDNYQEIFRLVIHSHVQARAAPESQEYVQDQDAVDSDAEVNDLAGFQPSLSPSECYLCGESFIW